MAYIKFKAGTKHPEGSGKNVQISEDINTFEDCGYLIEENEVIVDIDHLDKSIIKALIDTFEIDTQVVWTDRGAHLYFTKPYGYSRRARGTVPLGFDVEYKTSKNTKGITIKRNGVVRRIENQGKRQELPFVLTPGWGGKSYKNLLGYSEGDNRNNELYKLKMQILTRPDFKKILKFVNDYIFAEPLAPKEFESTARFEEIAGQKDGERATADIIMRDKRVVKYNGDLFYMEDGQYYNDPDQLNRLVYAYCPEVKSRYIDEVIRQMDYRCELIPPDKVFPVMCDNGYFYNGAFVPATTKDFTPYHINIEYDPNAQPVEEVDNYLEFLTNGNKDYQDLICEVLGHILITDKEMKRLLAKFFIFVGDGGNGKGTLFQVIKSIFGDSNCSALSIQNMADEKYFNRMNGRLTNLGDDIEDEALTPKQLKNLKNLSSADPVEMRRLYENSRTVEMTISLLFTSNHILKSFEKGDAYKRRVMWLPMYNKPKTKQSDFISKLTTPEALRYWLKLIAEGYFRLYKNKEFSDPDLVHEFNLEYHDENNNTETFVKCLTDSEIDGFKPKEVYDEYCQWCEDEGEKPLSKKTFNQSILNIKGYKSKPKRVNGRTTRVYTKVD